MGQQDMTRPQLAEFVSGQIRDILGKEMSELIRKNIEESVAPLKQQVTDWGSRIVDRPQKRQRVLGPRRFGSDPVDDEMGLDVARCIRATAAAKFLGESPDYAVHMLRKWGNPELAEQWQAARAEAIGPKSTPLKPSQRQIPFARFFFNDTATTEIYTLSLHDALPICLTTPCTCCGSGAIRSWPSSGRRPARRL